MLFVGDEVEWLLPMPLTFLLLALVFWLWRRFWPAMTRARWVVGSVLGLWFLLMSIPMVGNEWLKRLEGEPLSVADQLAAHDRVDAIIVPGSGGPPVNGRKAVQHWGGYVRLVAAVEAWQQKGGMLIFMGGMSESPEDSLAAGMRDLAIQMGVPADRIRIVPDSATTQQDLAGAARILSALFPAPSGGEGSVGPDPARRIALVTSAVHMERSQATARRLGLATIPVRCDYRQISRPGWRAWLPNNGAAWELRRAMHETVGLLVYRLRGWAD